MKNKITISHTRARAYAKQHYTDAELKFWLTYIEDRDKTEELVKKALNADKLSKFTIVTLLKNALGVGNEYDDMIANDIHKNEELVKLYKQLTALITKFSISGLIDDHIEFDRVLEEIKKVEAKYSYED